MQNFIDILCQILNLINLNYQTQIYVKNLWTMKYLKLNLTKNKKMTKWIFIKNKNINYIINILN